LNGDERRPALWEAGAMALAVPAEEGTQLALPLDGAAPPPLPELGPWERMVADYRTTGITLGSHPMELLRPDLDSGIATSADLELTADGAGVAVAGMVVARQRPATANGVVFMLLEDEHGTANLVIPPPVVERCRWAVRTSGFVLARGKLEHREGTTNVVVTRIEKLAGREAPAPQVKSIASPSGHQARRGRDEHGAEPARPTESGAEPDKPWRGTEAISELDRPGRERIVAELAAALPAPHSFGRRGR
jgi:error-prone DNA polymerase